MPFRRLRNALALLLFCSPIFGQITTPSADELVRIALQRNQSYLAALERVKEAEALARQAGLRPTPTIEIETATGAILGSRGESEYSAGYFHNIEMGGKRASRIAVAEKAIQLAEAQAREAEREIRADVKMQFINASAEEMKLAAVRGLQPANQENYELTTRRVEFGDAAPLEQRLLLTEINASEARQALMTAAARAAALELNAAVGLSPGEPLQPADRLEAPSRDLNLAELQTAALEQRPDLRVLVLLEDQSAAETELARAEGRPDITASARYTRSSARFDQSGLDDSGAVVPLRDNDNVMSFGISIPLFTRSRAAAGIEAAQSRQIQRRLQREQLTRLIPREVEAAYRRWEGAMRAVELWRAGVIAPSEQNLNVMRAAYRLGHLRVLDVLNEQRRLVDLQLSYVDAQVEAARALVELERAVGGNLP